MRRAEARDAIARDRIEIRENMSRNNHPEYLMFDAYRINTAAHTGLAGGRESHGGRHERGCPGNDIDFIYFMLLPPNGTDISHKRDLIFHTRVHVFFPPFF